MSRWLRYSSIDAWIVHIHISFGGLIWLCNAVTIVTAFMNLAVRLRVAVATKTIASLSSILQIPDVEGNDYCLNLYKGSFASSKWLNCLERCTSHGEYDIVAYNTPTGIFLQTVRDVVPGQQLCVAYDLTYGEFSHGFHSFYTNFFFILNDTLANSCVGSSRCFKN